MSLTDWDLCKGCDCYSSVIIEGNRCDGRIEPNIGSYHCPCINCLLKMCCSVTCKAFDEYSKKFENNFS